MMSDNYDIIAEDPLYNFQNNDKLFSGGFNDDSNCGLLVPLENSENLNIFQDLNYSNPNVNELVDILSNHSNSSNHNIMDFSLDDIPLTESAVESSVLQLVPDNIPENNILLLKVPECLQNDPLLNEMLDIELDKPLLNTIDASIQGHDGIFLTKPSENEEIAVIRRPPLQLIQQVIKFPVIKNVRSIENDEKKKPSKRKQHFDYPREDRVEFYSDDEDNIKDNRKKEDNPPSPKKPKTSDDQEVEQPKMTEEQPDEKPVIIDDLLVEISNVENPKNNKTRAGFEKCPTCDKNFRRLVMHKCKELGKASAAENVVDKLKPSEVPTLKCTICKEFFGNQKALDQHTNKKHSHLICKICKTVLKKLNLLEVHIAKCGIDIQPVEPVQKRALRNLKNRK